MSNLPHGLGVSTGTLYYYFPSKQALFEQLVEEISEQDVIVALSELGGIETLPEKMAALGNYLVKNEDYLIKWTYVWVDFCQNQDSKTLFNNSKVFQRANKRYQQATCEFLGIESQVLASFVLSFVNGVILEKLCGDQTIDFLEQCQLLGEMLIAYFEKNCISIKLR
ncbi:MAG: TetR/AcrR family transcriptional regulator [Sphaerospermopsis sp. SIO1G2]|nr:TetR/AcrR family transcriptional regulator [Sphaerospermopsis sp. SIO1G2]